MRCTHGCPSWNTSRAQGARYAPPEALEFRLSRLLSACYSSGARRWWERERQQGAPIFWLSPAGATTGEIKVGRYGGDTPAVCQVCSRLRE